MIHARQDYNERIQDSANLIPKDEPVFLLRAQDLNSPEAVIFWAKMAKQNGASDDIVNMALEHAKLMEEWILHHRCKVPDLPKPEEATPDYSL